MLGFAGEVPGMDLTMKSDGKRPKLMLHYRSRTGLPICFHHGHRPKTGIRPILRRESWKHHVVLDITRVECPWCWKAIRDVIDILEERATGKLGQQAKKTGIVKYAVSATVEHVSLGDGSIPDETFDREPPPRLGMFDTLDNALEFQARLKRTKGSLG